LYEISLQTVRECIDAINFRSHENHYGTVVLHKVSDGTAVWSMTRTENRSASSTIAITVIVQPSSMRKDGENVQ
jgi:hypothetical protein